MMSETSHITLRRIAPEANMQRQYSVTVGRDLFGQPRVTCRWGRIGARGQMKDHLCATLEEAQTLAAQLVQKRLKRGYELSGQSENRSQRDKPAVAKVPVRAPRKSRADLAAATAQDSLLTWRHRRMEVLEQREKEARFAAHQRAVSLVLLDKAKARHFHLQLGMTAHAPLPRSWSHTRHASQRSRAQYAP